MNIKRVRVYVAAMLFLSATLIIGLGGCTKDNGESTLNVRLTDNPVAFDQVNVDIREVNVNMGDDDGGWILLDTHDGVYNLLDLQNGVDTLLATAVVPAETVREIRFVLGPNNNVVVGGVTYPLTIPSGSESGLKIKVNKNLNENIETLIIDFDAALSIKEEPGGYKLRPVLKVK